jgi:hypothetical protein
MSKDNTKYKSKIQEKRVAKELKGKTTIASGATDLQKADVRTEAFLVEAKTTAYSHYSLTLKTWDRVREQALRDGMRIPLMCIDLRDGVNKIAVIDHNDFYEYSLDKFQYVGKPTPDFIDAKSYRITPDFLYEDFSQKYKSDYYRRRDFKFVDTGRHLVMLEWSEFLDLLEKVQSTEM